MPAIKFSDQIREDIARILETIARDGLEGPRDLDVALDAISESIVGESVQRIDDLGVIYWFSGDEDATEAFGGAVEVTPGIFIPTETP